MTAQAGVGPGYRLLDRYEIVRHVATGGMGTVWEARDLALDQVVALKSVGFAALGGTEAENSRLRTLREARFAAQLRGHPHVVSIYDVQEVDGEVWLVMEYLPSRTLAEITRDGETLDVAEAARIGAAVADALAAAHERGIIHRDVKPANVLIGLDGRDVRLTDFGISHGVGEHPLTSANVLAGTPAYMSREVARGDDETPATDVFSLGATLYRIVEGRPPFGEDINHRRLLQRVANDSIDLPRRAGPLTPVLLALLDPDPTARPDAARARQMLADVAGDAGRPLDPAPPVVAPPGPDATPTSITAPPPRPRRPGRRALLTGVAVLVAAGLVGGVVYANSDDPTAIPAIPTSLPASLAMTGDPRTADPCALMDTAVMGRFGQPARLGPGSNIGECRVTVPTPTGTAVVAAAYTTERTRASDGGNRQELGGGRIVRMGLTPQGCTTIIVLNDGTQIGIDVDARTPNDVVPNLCEINDAAVAVAADRLASSGIVHRPGWQGPITLLGRDPCRILDGAVESVPALDAARRNGYPNGARCFIGYNQAGRTLVDVRLGLEPTGDFSNFPGLRTTVGGTTVYTAGSAPNREGTSQCTAYLVHRPSYDGGVSGPAEYIDVAVSGPQPSDQLCRQAVRLVQVAERKASG